MSNLASFPAQSFPSCLRFVMSTEHAIFSLSLESLDPLSRFLFLHLAVKKRGMKFVGSKICYSFMQVIYTPCRWKNSISTRPDSCRVLADAGLRHDR